MRARLLIVGTAYAIKEHRKKLPYLARDFDLTCVTAKQCGGFGWTESLNGTEASEGYRLVGLPIAGDATMGTRCWYRGLADIYRRGNFDVILVESEPWALLRWQNWIYRSFYQRKAIFGEFTWENIKRGGWKGKALGAIYRLATSTESFAVGGNRDAAVLMKSHGSHPKRTACLPQFGVDPAIFAPLTDAAKGERRRGANLPVEGFLIAYCGRLVPEKGIADLLEAFRLLPQSGPRITLLIMGTGKLEEEVRAASSRDPRIRLCPPSTYPEISEFLQMIDLLVLPSRTSAGPAIWWKEQFGHILIEAMACEVASIGSNSGAIPEILGDAAVVFPEGNVAALTSLIESFLANPGRARDVGAAQRERVLQHYTHQQVAKGWSAFLQQCVATPS